MTYSPHSPSTWKTLNVNLYLLAVYKSLIDLSITISNNLTLDTALYESSSTQSEMPLLSLHSVAKVAAMWRWVKKSVSENLKSLGAVKSVETANLSFSQILRIC